MDDFLGKTSLRPYLDRGNSDCITLAMMCPSAMQRFALHYAMKLLGGELLTVF